MKERIFDILREACALEEDISEETRLDEISLDSLSFVEAIVAIEGEFDVEFDPDEAEIAHWETAGEIVRKTEEMTREKI